MFKQLASFKGDLSSITAPPFVLSTTSLTEYPAYWAEQPARFVAPAREPDPLRRALLVLTWFLTTLKQSYDHRRDRKKGKPLNPFLGELFLGKYESRDGDRSEDVGTTELVSEQVCHHPPVTAYRVWNERHGVTLEGYHAQRTTFQRGTIHIKKVGHALLHVDAYDEDYLITLPAMHLEGLIPPPPFPEFDSDRPTYIQSSSGYVAKIVYSGKGWFRGKKNSFHASLFREGQEGEVLFVAEGQWTGGFIVREGGASKTEIERYDASTSQSSCTPLTIAPLESQDPLESRRAWRPVTAAIENGDMKGVVDAKSKLEVRQRELRKEEQAEGREWQRRYFQRVEGWKTLEALAAKVGEKVEPDVTCGIWRWKVENVENGSMNP